MFSKRNAITTCQHDADLSKFIQHLQQKDAGCRCKGDSAPACHCALWIIQVGPLASHSDAADALHIV